MRERFDRFMQGRYGQDALTIFLLRAVVVLCLMNLFLKSKIWIFSICVFLFCACFRVFSKNHAARTAENQKFLDIIYHFGDWQTQQMKLQQERKYHHIYVCPKCRQKIRIPKGKGKIMVRCPRCRHEFLKRS